MNKKGQALIEFILIIPFVVILLIGVFDYVKINNTKLELSNELDSYILSDSYKLDESIKLTKSNNKYIVSKDVSISSAFLVPIIGSKYKVEVSRVINE